MVELESGKSHEKLHGFFLEGVSDSKFMPVERFAK
jgi:hypothetical protein